MSELRRRIAVLSLLTLLVQGFTTTLVFSTNVEGPAGHDLPRVTTPSDPALMPKAPMPGDLVGPAPLTSIEAGVAPGLELIAKPDVSDETSVGASQLIKASQSNRQREI